MSEAHFHVPENYVEDASHCDPADIEKFRSNVRGEKEFFDSIWDELERLYPQPRGKVDEATLQRENPVKRGGGGASGRKREKPVKISPTERMRKREQAMKFDDPQNYLSETEEQKAHRQLIEAQKRTMQRLKTGRPLKGEVRLRVGSWRVLPGTAETFKAHNVDVGPLLDAIAARLRAKA